MNGFLRRDDIITSIMQATKLTRLDCEVLLDTVLDEMTECLRKGEPVTINKFGSFRIEVRKGGFLCTIPHTGEKKMVRDTKFVKFRPSRELRGMVGMYVKPIRKKKKKATNDE